MKISMKKKFGIVIASLFFSFVVVRNANAVAYTWSASSAGAWNTAANWSPTAIPGTGDTVTFNATSVQNCTIDVPVTVTSITVTTGYIGTITQSYNVTVSGDFSVNGTAVRWNMGGKTLTVGGNCYILGTDSLTNGGVGTQQIILTGTGTFDTTGIEYGTIGTLTCAQNGNTTTLAGSSLAIYSTGALNIGTGTLNIPAGFSLNNNSTVLTFGTGGGMTGEGVYSVATTNMTFPGGTYPNLTTLNSGNITMGGNITIAGSVGQLAIINATLDTNNNSITSKLLVIGLAGGTGTLECKGSNIYVTGNMQITSTGTLNAGSSNLQFSRDDGGAAWTHDAGGTFNSGTSTIQFSGNNPLPSETFYNLTISGPGKTTILTGNCTVNNNLTISSGATLDPVTNNKTVTVNGSLIVSSATALPSGSNVIVNGNLTNNGTFNTTNLNLTLNGNVTNNGTLTTSLAINGNLTNSGTLNTNSLTVSANKTALLNAGSVWNVGTGNTITIRGTLKSSGTSSNSSTIKSTSGYYGLTTSGGNVDLSYCKLYYLNKDGLKIDTTGTITKMDNVELKDGETGGTHLSVLNGQTVTITNIVFDDITNGTNITVKNKSKIKVSKFTRGNNKDSIESGSSVLWGVEQSINSKEGGRIASADDPLTYIEIPKGVLKKDLTFTLVKLYPDELSDPSQPTKVIYAYSLDAIDNEGKEVKILDGPIILVLHTKTDGTEVLDSTNTRIGIPVSQASNRLSIGYWNERYWVKLGGRVELLNIDRDVTVSARVSHLSRYAMITKEASQSIQVNVSPNPFTPASSDSRFNRCNWTFNNENNEEVELKIWDITATLIRTITSSGTSSISWDGRDEYGNIVEGGVYIWQLKVGNNVAGKGTVVVAK